MKIKNGGEGYLMKILHFADLHLGGQIWKGGENV